MVIEISHNFFNNCFKNWQMYAKLTGRYSDFVICSISRAAIVFNKCYMLILILSMLLSSSFYTLISDYTGRKPDH